MTWQDCLDLGPTRIAQILGCPVTTAANWINRSGPPEWQQSIFLEIIKKAEQGAARKRGKHRS